MTELNKFERAVLQKLLQGDHPVLVALREQLAVCAVKDRENTGVGFYTSFEMRQEAKPSPARKLKFGDVAAEISGVQHGAGFVLYVEEGYLSMLEGYTYDEPWPASTEEFELSYFGGAERDWDKLSSELEKGIRNDGGDHSSG